MNLLTNVLLAESKHSFIIKLINQFIMKWLDFLVYYQKTGFAEILVALKQYIVRIFREFYSKNRN